jgi:Holliday junction resolvase RusA-like endonuclease
LRGPGSPKKKRKDSYSITIPIKALSVNKLYSGQKTRSWHYKKFRKKVFQLLNGSCKSVDLSGNLQLTMEIGFSSPLSDLSNGIKGIEDLISEYLGINDRQVFVLHAEKYLVNKGDEYIQIRLHRLRKNFDRRGKPRKAGSRVIAKREEGAEEHGD